MSVAFLRRQINEAWEGLPCNGCKLFVKILTHAVLAHVGLPLLDLVNHAPFPDVGIRSAFGEGPGALNIPISKAAMVKIGNLGTANDTSDLSQFLGSLPHWGTIEGVFAAFDWIFTATDRFYTWPCRKIGCCPL